MLTRGIPLAEWGTLALLLALRLHDGEMRAMLSRPWLSRLGRMSYGLYLWHYPVFVYLRARYPWDDVLLLGAPLSLGLAALSFYTVERWAQRAGRTPRTAGAQPEAV